MVGITVIIPTCDRPDLLARAVSSVLTQSVPPQKIIIVDNGVHDTYLSPSLMHGVDIVRTAPRIGSGRSRNIGALAACTEWIAFLDDDDVWDVLYLENAMSIIGGGVKIVACQLKRQAPGDEVRPYKLFPSVASDQRSIYYKNPGFGGQNILLERQFFLAIGGFDEDMPASVDRDLAARILQVGETIHVQEKSVAILCDHEGQRVRHSQVRGNRMFIAKHWRSMYLSEFFRASITYLKRLVKSKIS